MCEMGTQQPRRAESYTHGTRARLMAPDSSVRRVRRSFRGPKDNVAAGQQASGVRHESKPAIQPLLNRPSHITHAL